jgi:subtilisin family serine protease
MKILAVIREKLTDKHGKRGFRLGKRWKQLARFAAAAFVLCFLLGEAAGQPAFSAGQEPPEGARQAGQPPVPPCTPAQWMVKFKDATAENLRLQDGSNSRAQAAQRLSEAAGMPLDFKREMGGGAFVFTGSAEAAGAAGKELEMPGLACLPPEQAQAIAEAMMSQPEVEYAEVDRILTITRVPNDPQYSSQWHYFAPTAGNYGINAPAAWDITTGSASVVVGVVDTGITNHADLAGRILPGYDMMSDAWMANDGGGRDADPSDPGDWVAFNDCYSGSEAETSSWHGTHVAGTIGASTNNAAGVAGVNWAARILPVRVLGRCGGYLSDISDGMRWAAGLAVPLVPANPNPAKVVNVSITGLGACGVAEQSAINDMMAAGTTVVIAAGNEGNNALFYTPASCSGAITVAATDRAGDLAIYSNFSETLIELSAPGGETGVLTNGVLSTLNTGLQGPVSDTYAYFQGTSMATPHVAGVASLLYGLQPNLTPAQVRAILQGTVTAFPVGSSCRTWNDCGSGIVNAGGAVGVLPRITRVSPNRANTSTSLTLTVDGGGFANGAVVRWNGAPLATTYVSPTRLTATLSTGTVSGMYAVTVTLNHPTYGNLTTLSQNFWVGLNVKTNLPYTRR